MPLRILRSKVHMFRHSMQGCLTFRYFSTIQPKVGVVGIDFGCKNSRVAIMESLVPRVVDSEIGHFTPSYVTLTELKSGTPYGWCMQRLNNVDKLVAVGQLAKFKMWRRPSDVVFNIKRLIGKEFNDPRVQEMRKRVQFSIIEGPRGEAWVEIHGIKFSPVDISSVILAKLKDAVLMYQYHHKLQVVISVPSFFSKKQREDIRLAGSTAGLDVLDIIDESTAAALSSPRKKGIVVVFGMGAGSYSISILHKSDMDIKVKAQSGDPFVGGDQFDDVLLDHFVSQINELHSVDIRGDKYAMTVLAQKVEQVKVDLTDMPTVTVSIPFFTASAEGPVDLNVTISRSEFEGLLGDLLDQIKHKCQSILKEAEISDKDIDEIVLFGAMTRMPKIEAIIHEVFGEHQISRVKPEEAVVIGSALQAALLVEESREFCDDMIPLSIGIESVNGTFIRVIPRNSRLPAKRTIRIPAWCGDGKCLCVRIFLGEHVMGHRNFPSGEIQLINSRNSCRSCTHFELTFEVDNDYVIKVNAVDADGLFEAAKTLTIDKSVLCKHNVDNALRDAVLNWPLCVTEIPSSLRQLATYMRDTLDDVLLTRRSELPKDLYEDAVNVLTDLRGALNTHDDLLGGMIVSAKLMISTVLNWTPTEYEHLQSDYSD